MRKLQFATSTLNPDEVEKLYHDKKYIMKEIANKLGISFWSLYNFMNKYNITRRDRSEATYLSNRLKPKFKINSKNGQVPKWPKGADCLKAASR